MIKNKVLQIITIATLCIVLSRQQGDCEGRCECYKKNGKQTAECREANFITIPDTLNKFTEVLHLEMNNIYSLVNDSFIDANLLDVMHVFMSDNGMVEVQPGAFRGLENLVEVDLSNNNLKRLHPQTFTFKKKFTILSLQRNPEFRLEEGTPLLTGVTSLLRLDLSFCKVKHIPDSAFSGLNLRDLNLKGNQLNTLNVAVVEHMKDLLDLDLSSNPWHCDCELKDMRDWYLQSAFDSYDTPKCAAPEKLLNRPWTDFHSCALDTESNILPNGPKNPSDKLSHIPEDIVPIKNSVPMLQLVLYCIFAIILSVVVIWFIFRGRPKWYYQRIRRAREYYLSQK